MTSTDFATLDLPPELIANLASLGYEQMTPIQAQSLPAVLSGRDVLGQAQTGSGKTAAFGLGLIADLDVTSFHVQGLVLCPTRELADQVAQALRQLARTVPNVKVLTLCGGAPFGPQANSLQSGAHIVVGTPGRVEDHLRKATLALGDVRMLVLDEADRMLDMGFQESLDAIVVHTPVSRQTLLFSATYPDAIAAVAQRVLTDPVTVRVADEDDQSSIEQQFFQVEDEAARLTAVKLLLHAHHPTSALVFCNTKRETQAVTEALSSARFSALALHGDLDQRERDMTLVRFANKSAVVLVATDVAARGLDISDLDAVINYQLANTPDVHVHRIGRTGRAGKSGLALTLYTGAEQYKMDALGEVLQIVISSTNLPPQRLLDKPPQKPLMATLRIEGGKKQKIRPGDILGALTGEGGVSGDQVGKINVFANFAYVAVQRDVAKAALQKLTAGKLKGRNIRVRRLLG